MEKTLYNYALIKSLYDQGHEYIDCFWPLVIQVIPRDKFVDQPFIQLDLKREFDIDMPLHVLGSVIKKVKAKGFVEQQRRERKYRLCERGERYRQKLETHKEVERRINALVGDMGRFFNEHGTELTEKEILKLISSFVHSNRNSVLEFINPAVSEYQMRPAKRNPHINLLIEFMQRVDRAEPENYAILKDVLLGSIISTTIYARDAVEFDNLGKKKFRDCRLYLDTNLVFSILQMHEPEFNKAATELHRLLKQFGFNMRVFQSTVSELCYTVKGYRTAFHRYPRDTRIDTIYSSLRRKGWKASDAHEFVIDVESRLQNHGITIDWSIDIDLNAHELQNEDLREGLKKYKPRQYRVGQTHDLAAIEAIQRIRGKKLRRLEECKAAFLTSDIRLSIFNFNELNHRSEGTVCEVFLDRMFTNILWLKNPKLDLPLGTIIAAHSRDLFVNRSVWERFYTVLQDLHQSKQVDDDKVSMLFYHNYVEDVLRGFDESEVDKITPTFVLGHIQERAKQIDKKLTEEVHKREKDFLTHLDADVERAKVEKNDEWLRKITEMKKIVRNSALKSGKRKLLTVRIVLTLVLLSVILYFLVKGDWESIGKAQLLMSFVATVVVIALGSIGKIWDYFEQGWSNRLYRNRLNESGLDKYV